jgi:hypothetical protein
MTAWMERNSDRAIPSHIGSGYNPDVRPALKMSGLECPLFGYFYGVTIGGSQIPAPRPILRPTRRTRSVSPRSRVLLQTNGLAARVSHQSIYCAILWRGTPGPLPLKGPLDLRIDATGFSAVVNRKGISLGRGPVA